MGEEIEEDLRTADTGLWRRAVDELRRAQLLYFWMQVVLVLGGAALSTYGQIWNLPTVAIIGVVMAFAGGIVLLAVQKGHADLIDEARQFVGRWRGVRDERDHLQFRLTQLAEEGLRRQQLITALDVMIDALEKTMSTPAMGLNARLDWLLRSSMKQLQGAMDLRTGDDWTISIFRRQTMEDGERMCRVAGCWEDRADERRDQRRWRLNEGYTGRAWHLNENVIEADTSSPEATGYFVSTENRRDDDGKRYRAVAAIPFRLAEDQEVWGVITATSARPGSFSRDTRSPGGRNVATIKSFTAIVAALAAAERMTA